MSNTFTIITEDNVKINATQFVPDKPTIKATVMIATAMAVPQGFYRRFAVYLAEQGFRVITFDYRGMNDGKTNRLNPRKIKMRDWGQQDVKAVIEWIQMNHNPDKLFFVGQSAGGQLVGLAKNNHHIDGYLMVTSQSGFWGHWSGRYKAMVGLLWYIFIPLLGRLLPYFPSKVFGMGEKIPSGVARQWARWGRHPEYITSDKHEQYFKQVTAPMLFYSFEDDPVLAPKPSVQAIYDFYQNADRTWHHLRPKDLGARAVGHFGFFRERFKETLWQDSVEWLKGLANR